MSQLRGRFVAAALAGCAAVALAACAPKECDGPLDPSCASVLSSTTTTSIAIGPSPAPTLFTGGIAAPDGSQRTINLSLRFNLPGGALVPTDGARLVSFVVTGTYIATGFEGSVQGTLDGTPDNGIFTGRLTANLPGCLASRNYSGPLKGQALNWAAGSELNSCDGTSPLGNVNAVSTASTTTSTPSTTSTPASTTTTTTPSTPSTTTSSQTTTSIGATTSIPATTSTPATTTVGSTTSSVTTTSVSTTSTTSSTSSSSTSTSSTSTSSSTITTSSTSTTTTSVIPAPQLTLTPTTLTRHVTTYTLTVTNLVPNGFVSITWNYPPGGCGFSSGFSFERTANSSGVYTETATWPPAVGCTELTGAWSVQALRTSLPHAFSNTVAFTVN